MGRFSGAEREIVIRKAEAVSLSVNSYIRATALGSDYQPPSDPALVRELFTMNRELTSQGNNLNQIARQLNGNAITPEQGASMLDVLGRLMVRTHKAVRKALTRGEMEPEQ